MRENHGVVVTTSVCFAIGFYRHLLQQKIEEEARQNTLFATRKSLRRKQFLIGSAEGSPGNAADIKGNLRVSFR